MVIKEVGVGPFIAPAEIPAHDHVAEINAQTRAVIRSPVIQADIGQQGSDLACLIKDRAAKDPVDREAVFQIDQGGAGVAETVHGKAPAACPVRPAKRIRRSE